MDKILRVMGKIRLFHSMPEEQLIQIKQIAQEKHFHRGEPIFWEGDEGLGFYVVVSGRIKIYKVSSEGKEQILHIYGPGHPFGEVPVFAGEKFPANALAVENSLLLFFPRQGFIDLITANPSLAMNMLAVLSVSLRQFTDLIENLSLKEVPGRLATYLVYLAEEQENKTTVHLPVSKGQLASLLGTIPETLSRIFNKMASQGLIDVQGADIRLIDQAALKDLSVNGRLNEES